MTSPTPVRGGLEQLDTVAVEWWGSSPDAVVRVRVADLRVMTGAVWIPGRRRPSALTRRHAARGTDPSAPDGGGSTAPIRAAASTAVRRCSSGIRT